jgi:hypothetical protein
VETNPLCNRGIGGRIYGGGGIEDHDISKRWRWLVSYDIERIEGLYYMHVVHGIEEAF